MSLSSLLGKAPKDNAEKITEWVGMKMQIADADELRQLLRTDASGAELFRKMLAFVVQHTQTPE